jgi:membrane protein DedA with SNARE-associated domain
MSIPLWLFAATFASEDLTCIGAGVLVASGQLSFAEAAAACFAGILGGDLLLYAAGRIGGSHALEWRWLRSRVSEAEIERAGEWLERKGLRAILVSRLVPGTRLPLYVGAGVVRASAWHFALYSALACAIWTPVLVGVAAWAGRESAEAALVTLTRLGLIAGLVFIASRYATWERRRRLWGRVLRIARWEFWPAWLAYVPVVLWLFLLAIRYRSLTVFTAANPAIPSGGLTGESKAAILAAFGRSPSLARWTLLHRNDPARFESMWHFMCQNQLSFPIVLKPDVGERGRGVSILRTEAEARAYLATATGDVILQEYVPGVEFGVLYCRRPDESTGIITSLTRKTFPTVVGDGVRTLKQLILADSRAVCASPAYLTVHRNASATVPRVGERVQLVEIGSHCRGAVFLDARDCWTPELAAHVNDLSRRFDGFFIGRYDVRAASVEEFRAGHFKVIELNGVAGEPAHIYDPRVSLVDAYRAFIHHWALAFAIGDANRRAGASVMTVSELFRWCFQRRGDRSSPQSGELRPCIRNAQ